jgi:hypothetical protein
LLNHTEHSVGNHYREFKPDETIGGENPLSNRRIRLVSEQLPDRSGRQYNFEP